MGYQSLIKISKSALKQNIDFLHRITGDDVLVSMVVKANAYGHGIEQFCTTAFELGVSHFSTFSFEEALRVHIVLPDADKMVMGWIGDVDIVRAVDMGIEFYVFDLYRLKLAIKASQICGKKAKVHLEVETGMNRTGLSETCFKQALAAIYAHPETVDLVGICSHLAGPESIANYYRIQKQIKRFEEFKTQAEQHQTVPKYYHLANSAATITYPETHYNMVRVGIISYGFWPSRETFIQYFGKHKHRVDPLQRIMKWESRIMTIKEIESGDFIGYGNYYLASKDMRLAIIPVGYSNSFNRNLSNKGRVLIHGFRCTVIGVVNMNMIIADITDIPDVEIGDCVVMIGDQGDVEISVRSFSDYSDQLSYETLSNLPFNIPRVVIE